MSKGYETCEECGKTIAMGDDLFESDTTGSRVFCSPECMREWIIGSDVLSDVVDGWVDAHARCCTLEPENPYDRYGVSESDFH